MLTHGEIKFLFEIHENHGKITQKEQMTFKSNQYFYQAISHLKKVTLPLSG